MRRDINREIIVANKVYFNLKTVSGWAARSDKGWCKFLNDNGVWPNQKNGGFGQAYTFHVPARAYYTIYGSIDNYGSVSIDGRTVLEIKDFKNTWSCSVLLEEGDHRIGISAQDQGGNYGAAVTVEADVDAQVDAENAASAKAAQAQAAQADYEAKQQTAVSAQAAVQAQAATEYRTTCTVGNKNAGASASSSGSASASAGASAGASASGTGASAGASASASAGASVEGSAEAHAGNQYAGAGASASGSAYADASATASAQAAAGLDGNNVTAGGSVEIIVRAETGVSAEAVANATILGMEVASATASGSASTYTEVYVKADGSMTVGQNGVAVEAGAIAGYGVGAGAQGTAGFDTLLGGGSVSGGAEVSIGAQVGVEGSAHATYKDGNISIGVAGEAALLVGLDADVSFDMDIGPAIDAANAVLKSGGSMSQAAVEANKQLHKVTVQYNDAQKQAQNYADQCIKAANDAKKVADDAAKAATDATNQATKVIDDAVRKTEEDLKKAGKTVTNGVVQLGNSVASGGQQAVDAVSKGASDAWKSTKKLFSDVRLKENIQHVAQVEGINVYSYNYVWDNTPQMGVMAQELLGTAWESAVSLHASGYYQVDYDQLPRLH